MPSKLLALCAALAATPLFAADPPADDLDALSLADKAPEKAATASAWRAYVEGAAGTARWRGAGDQDTLRAALDLRYDGTLTPGVRAVLSNRVDAVRRRGDTTDRREVNSLREAYLSWQRTPEQVFDVGRVNVRHGAAWGYNPTDFFRGNALRAIVSPDPAALRENRLGTVVLRGQRLWSGGALSAAWSPKLADAPNDSAASLDLGSTNDRHRWLLTASTKLGGLDPQVLLHGGRDTPAQLGLNVSTLLGNATIAFAEFATGRSDTLVSRARAQPERRRHHRAAVGLTVTTAFNLSVTAELDHNGAAPDRAQWNALSPLERLRVLDLAQRAQDLPVRHGVFLYATWKDALVRRLDLSGFVRHEPPTRSRWAWLEARYRFDRMDVSLQWQHQSGDEGSVFGLVPQERAVEVALRWYL